MNSESASFTAPNGEAIWVRLHSERAEKLVLALRAECFLPTWLEAFVPSIC